MEESIDHDGDSGGKTVDRLGVALVALGSFLSVDGCLRRAPSGRPDSRELSDVIEDRWGELAGDRRQVYGEEMIADPVADADVCVVSVVDDQGARELLCVFFGC
jgi:hypothetical protein